MKSAGAMLGKLVCPFSVRGSGVELKIIAARKIFLTYINK